eukprot:2124754-Rhodomonas_salina.1
MAVSEGGGIGLYIYMYGKKQALAQQYTMPAVPAKTPTRLPRMDATHKAQTTIKTVCPSQKQDKAKRLIPDKRMDPVLARMISDFHSQHKATIPKDSVGDFTNRIILCKDKDVRYFMRMISMRLNNEFDLLPRSGSDADSV